jgi:hypothetical protein
MIESVFTILLLIFGAYAVMGLATAVWFFAWHIKRLDAPAAGGSMGFRILVAPGVILLWPLILMKSVLPPAEPGPDGAEELRRGHRRAIFVLAAVGLLTFAAALIWRMPAFSSLPTTETTRP